MFNVLRLVSSYLIIAILGRGALFKVQPSQYGVLAESLFYL